MVSWGVAAVFKPWREAVVLPFATNMGGIQEPNTFTHAIIVMLVLEFDVLPTTFLDPLSEITQTGLCSNCDLFRRIPDLT